MGIRSHLYISTHMDFVIGLIIYKAANLKYVSAAIKENNTCIPYNKL